MHIHREDTESSMRGDFPTHRREHAARRDIIADGATTTQVHVLVEGWAAPYRMLPDGRRQLICILLPGDHCHIDPFGGRPPAHPVTALTNCVVDTFHQAAVRENANRDHREMERLWSCMATQMDAQREWAASLGRRSASERLAHLFCTIMDRQVALGVADGRACPFHLTQADLADLTGLTAVHINRTLSHLRASELIRLDRRSLAILDPERLADLAMVTPKGRRHARAATPRWTTAAAVEHAAILMPAYA